MLSVTRRVALAILALAITALPATTLHARTMGVEGETTSWTARVVDQITELLGLLGADRDTGTGAAIAASSGGGTSTGAPTEPALVPDDGTVMLLPQPSGELRPAWDPNGSK